MNAYLAEFLGTALLILLGNGVVANVVLRTRSEPGATLPFVLSIVGVGLLFVSGWLGWELIYGQGVAMSENAETRIRLRERARGRAAS